MPIVLQVILLVLLYIVGGSILSVPYTYLANGSLDLTSLGMTTMFVILLGVFLSIFDLMPVPGMNLGDNKRTKWDGGFFWAMAAYFCSPILLNGASLFLKWAGYETVGQYVFSGRYLILMVVPAFLPLWVAIAIGVMSCRQRGSGGTTPPSSTPPSGFDLDKTTTVRKTDPSTFQFASA